MCIFFAYYCRLAAPKSAATASPVFAIINCTATTCVASDVVDVFDVAATRVIAPSKKLLSTCTRRIAMALLINMLTHTHTHTYKRWLLHGYYVAASWRFCCCFCCCHRWWVGYAHGNCCVVNFSNLFAALCRFSVYYTNHENGQMGACNKQAHSFSLMIAIHAAELCLEQSL